MKKTKHGQLLKALVEDYEELQDLRKAKALAEKEPGIPLDDILKTREEFYHELYGDRHAA